jgi:hypothetical protein
MSSISATNPALTSAYVQTPKSATVTPQQQTPAQVQPTGSDSDGDNDGSKGGTINTYA